MEKRRRFAVLCALVGVMGLMAMSTPPAGAAKKGAYDPNGVLRRAIDMNANGGVSFDPLWMAPGEYIYAQPVLSSLLVLDKAGNYKPGFATKVDVPNGSTIVVTLRSGLKFSNGETLDATAVKNSIDRVAKAAAGSGAVALRVAELRLVSSVEVNSPTQFTITTTGQNAGRFYPLLADAETAPVAPASIAANTSKTRTVIAAGPFKIDSYTPGTGVKMSKNPNYWDAKNIKLGGLEMVHVATGPGNIANALRSNAVDWGGAGPTQLPFTDTPTLSKPIKVVYHRTDAAWISSWCIKDGTPLGNLQVRQALNYATDRDEINAKLYDGKSAPAWTLWPSDNPYGRKSLDKYYKYDLTKAKQLLTQAGYPNGFELTSVAASTGEGNTIDTILQAQWAKVGVKLNITISTQPSIDFMGARVEGSKTNQFTVPMTRAGLSRLTRLITTDASGNPCKNPVTQIDALAAQLSPLAPDDPQIPKLYAQVDEAFTKTYADGVLSVWVVQSLAYNADRVGGVAYTTDAIQSWAPDFTKIYIKKAA